jgi:hypothetical protein
MNILTFGFFGEDAAQKQFLMAYLDQQCPDLFIESEEFGWKVKASNKTEVDKGLKNAAFQAFVKFNLKVLFIGRDTDMIDDRKIIELQKQLIEKCHPYKGAILMVPVQCIEHWLWYLKWKLENPKATKNPSFESNMRSQAKLVVYGEKNTGKTRPLALAELVHDLDVAWLESRSESFRHFHQQVIAFLKAQENG